MFQKALIQKKFVFSSVRQSAMVCDHTFPKSNMYKIVLFHIACILAGNIQYQFM